MSDYKQCIANALAEGNMSAAQAERATQIYDGFYGDLIKSLPPEEAARQAAKEAFTVQEAEALHRRRQLRLTQQRMGHLGKLQDSYRNSKGEFDPGQANQALIEYDTVATFENVKAQERAIRGLAHAKIDQVILKFHRTLTGKTPHQADLYNVVREAFGENTGDASAKAMAIGWGEAAEMLRKRYNAAGGAIGKNDNWGMPTHHDAGVLRRTPYSEWRDALLPRINRDKMLDDLTGKPMTDQRLELALKSMYDAVVTQGWTRKEAARAMAGTSLANRRGKERFIQFNSADDWLWYQQRFGAADPFNIMMAHIDQMSRDIAAMEMFGPNPQATLTWLKQRAEKAVQEQAGLGAAARLEQTEGAKARNKVGRTAEKEVRRVQSQNKITDKMWSIYTGESRIPEHVGAAEFWASVRNYLVSSQLGSTAVLALPTDAANQAAARQFAGMKASGVVWDTLKMLNPFDASDRALAIRSGLIAEHASRMSLAQARYVGEVTGSQMSRQVADTILRITWLSPGTQAARWSFGMEFMGHLADQVGKSFDELNTGTQRVLKRHGMDADWEDMRRAVISDDPKEKLMTPHSLREIEGLTPSRADELQLKLLRMIGDETEFAVPTASLRAQAFFMSSDGGGSVAGELSRSFQMYKSFPATITFMHGRRVLSEGRFDGRMKGAVYAARYLGYSTLAAAMSMQLTDMIAKGKDPRDMKDPSFWGSAMLRGGGLGIWGDFLTAENNRFGGGIEQTLAGPMGGLMGDVLDLTAYNAVKAITGEDTDVGSDLVRMVRRYTPGGSMWYTRLAWERTVVDELQEMVDPKAARKFKAKITSSRRETGQEFWWAPGDRSPDRPPDLAAAID